MTAGAVVRADALAALFPPGVVAFERREPGEIADLLPVEAACSVRFVPTRRAEFAAGRACARAALAVLGRPGVAIPRGDDRSPQWPPGFVGSISHTEAYCAAVATTADLFAGIGLDVEIEGRVKADLWDQLFVPEERARFAALPVAIGRRAAAIAFGAKEAFYKCQYAVTRAWVDFHDVIVDVATPEEPSGSFTLRAAGMLPAARATLPLTGRFRITGGIVAAGVAIVRRSP